MTESKEATTLEQAPDKLTLLRVAAMRRYHMQMAAWVKNHANTQFPLELNQDGSQLVWINRADRRKRLKK